ncbi:MAG TPA: hypothetical protein GX510_08675 [Firmicutes bacterium]|nr:hypothetical protein [Candidatus Fermentithermobacillaceae bacterium]
MKRSLPGVSWKAIGVLALVTAFLAAITCYALVSKRRSGAGENAPPERAARAVFETRYLLCGCVVVEERELEGGKIDVLSASGAPVWQLAGAREGLQCFFRVVNDYCPEHSRFRLITLKDGVVAVYRGKRAVEGFLLKSYPELQEGLMTPGTKQALTTGVLVEGDPREVDHTVKLYLEGIID